MLLTIDVGNTNTEYGIYEGEKLTHTFRLMTKNSRTSDEIGLTVCDYFHRFSLDVGAVEGVIIASVVPEIMYSLKSAMIKYFGVKPLVVNEDVYPGLRYLYDISPELGSTMHGADRSVACMAAAEKYGAPLLVLDFGTASTIDAVRTDGVYVGGSIFAGLNTTMNALAAQASMLPTVELKAPEQFLNYELTGHIQAGVVGGYIGSVEYLIRCSKAEMEEPDEEIKVIATGGLSSLIAAQTDAIDIVDAELIPDGLMRIYRRQEKQ